MKKFKDFLMDLVKIGVVALIAEIVIYVCDESVLYDLVFRQIYRAVSSEMYTYILLVVGIAAGINGFIWIKKFVDKFDIKFSVKRR